MKGTFVEFGEDKVLRLSAAMAYYAMFSIGPLLIIAVGVAGLAFGHQVVQQQIETQLQSMVGAEAAKTLGTMMATQKHDASVITTVIGVIALLFGAAGVFGQLQDSLNTIWEVKPKPGTGLWGFVRSRFLSFSMVLGTGFLLLISLAITTFLSAVTGSLGNIFPIPEALAHFLNFLVNFIVVTLLFAMIFKYLPDVKIPFRTVWVGAIGTSLLFTLGKYLLALYLGRESTTSSYGAAGSVIVILLWIYYASLILFFGAEFTQVYARQTGAIILPSKHAVPMAQEERVQEGIPHDQTLPPARPSRETPSQPTWEPAAQGIHSTSPGAVVHQHPWQFLSLMLVAGFVGAMLLRPKWLRRSIQT